MNNNDIILSQIRQRLEILYQMVDELEASGGGGGGGGGTTNYNDLSNKPSIEGQQLVGNKTASDLGLATTSQLNRKVDKEEGSSLMTAAQATKLEGIQAGAEVNVQADWNQTNSNADDYIKNKPTIPTPITVDQTYNATSANAQSGKAVAQAISTKVDKETGKGLSTNDFTNTDKANLETALTKANAAAPQSTTYTKTEVDTALEAKLDTTDFDAVVSSVSILQKRVNDVSDYGKLTIDKTKTTYNSAQRKLKFLFDMSAIGSDFQLRQVGLIATSNAAIKYQLTLDTTPETDVTFVKTSDITQTMSSTSYTWTKTAVSANDTWYVVPFMKYDNGDDFYLKYGHLYSITVNNDGTLAIIAICKE